MNELELLHKKIEDNDWDASNGIEINTAYLEIVENLISNEDLSTAHLAEVERQAFAFSKTPEKKLSYKLAGDKTLTDGTTIPYEWPDINTFVEDDFIYLKKRFDNSKNNFVIAEFGLVLYYTNRLKTNEDIFTLFSNLFNLAKKYLSDAKEDNSKKHSVLYYGIVLDNALYIGSHRKSVVNIFNLYKELIHYIFLVHQEWEIQHSMGLRTILDITDLAVQYFNDFNELVSLDDLLKKNWQAADYLSNTYVWGAIYVADNSVRLLKKLKLSTNYWLIFKAKQYEKLYEESRQQKNMAAVSFVEKAMSIYKSIKDFDNFNRLEGIYQDIRNEFELGESRIDMPQDEIQRLSDQILKVITESDEEGIIRTLMGTPMIMSLEEIKAWSKKSYNENMLINMFPTSVLDKFGNTSAIYDTEDKKEEHALLNTYEFHLQIALQTIVQLFMEAFRAEKISAEGIMFFLSKTWYNTESRKIYGREVKIDNLALIESGVKSIFQELNLWKINSGYLPNFISATDSLVLKVEYFTREFIKKLGKSTFVSKPKKPEIIMEKLFDELLRDLEGNITEDDHFFIKFILTEKSGYNLRNKIAHGLMDSIEYSIQTAILPLIIILKLSNYQFAYK